MRYLILSLVCFVLAMFITWYASYYLSHRLWALSFIITCPLGAGVGGFIAVYQNKRDEEAKQCSD